MTNNKRLTKDDLTAIQADADRTYEFNGGELVRVLLEERAEAVRLLKACRSELETDPNAGEYYADLIAELKAFES